jgi:hypothetical protein
MPTSADLTIMTSVQVFFSDMNSSLIWICSYYIQFPGPDLPLTGKSLVLMLVLCFRSDKSDIAIVRTFKKSQLNLYCPLSEVGSADPD